MDPSLEELSRLAHNALLFTASPNDPPSPTQIARYQHLFHYSATTALSQITQQRNDPTSHGSQPPSGLPSNPPPQPPATTAKRTSTRSSSRVRHSPLPPPQAATPHPGLQPATEAYPPLDEPSTLQAAAHLPAPRRVLDGEGEDGPAHFCVVDAAARRAIEAWLSEHHSPLRPTFIRHSLARKALCAASAAPTLGIDATLPQHRPSTATPFLPAQDQFPVWYFFYGTLADPGVLAAQLRLGGEEAPVLRSARVRGGVLRRWGGEVLGAGGWAGGGGGGGAGV
ncbi:hypothetical protein MMC17_000092 [Xylographa soralifera]|nr:hypothetical protein [Xylographa soralifera]